MKPTNTCQAYHTPTHLQDRLKNIPYNKHLCFIHGNISFYCLLSEYLSFKQDRSFVMPNTLGYVARNLRVCLEKIKWPDRLDRQFIQSEMAYLFSDLDSNYLVYLRESNMNYQLENGYSCCSISLVLYQRGVLWGVQLGKNRVGLCSPSIDPNTPLCVAPCDEHSFESDTEKTRLSNTGLNNYDLSEFFQYQHKFMPTRSIGNLTLKENFNKSILKNAHSPPSICVPDVWGPIDIEYQKINHGFIINDDLYKVFERHCFFKIGCTVLERVGEFILQDRETNDNSTRGIFNDCGRRVIENILKAIGPYQLDQLYRQYNIVDMGIVIIKFDAKNFSSPPAGGLPSMDSLEEPNHSGLQGFVKDPDFSGIGHNNHSIAPQTAYGTNDPSMAPFTNNSIRPISRSNSGQTVVNPIIQPSSLPPSGVQPYLRFDNTNPIWNIQSVDQLMK